MSNVKRAKKMENNLHTVTSRFSDPLFKRMQDWLDKNGISANQLLARAVDKYISEPQVLEPVKVQEAKDVDVKRVVKKMMVEHKRALDELK